MTPSTAVSTVTPQQLAREARSAVRGLGRYIRHELEIRNTGCRLIVHFVRHYNPNRPLHVQAVEKTEVAL